MAAPTTPPFGHPSFPEGGETVRFSTSQTYIELTLVKE